MTYLMLYGVGWTQRWQFANAAADQALAEFARVGGVPDRARKHHAPRMSPDARDGMGGNIAPWERGGERRRVHHPVPPLRSSVTPAVTV
jgi:hypothetical protein